MDFKSKIILISGPTAAGKSKFAIKLAKKVNGEIIKNVILGRLETSEDFKVSEKQKTIDLNDEIEDLKITVRSLNKEDIKNRKLPNQTTGLVIMSIQNNSPLAGSIEVNSIIVEAQKERIKSIDDLKKITKQVLNSNQKTILLAIYNNQNQKRYIGIKLD